MSGGDRYGPRLDRIRPPDVAEPANVIDAVVRALPLARAQKREDHKERMDSKAAARQELWMERDAGHWTDPSEDPEEET